MIQYLKPVYRNSKQGIKYTYHNEDGYVIDLSGYGNCWLELKVYGNPYTIAIASITSVYGGVVELDSFTFPIVGIWSLQFFVEDGSGNILPGEPLQLRVVPNVDDLALQELQNY